MSEGHASVIKSGAQNKVLNQLHLRCPSSRHPAYCRPLQPLTQWTNHQQDGSRLRTIIKYSRDAQLEGTVGKGLAFLEQGTCCEMASLDRYRVIDGHKILAIINTHIENGLVREIALPLRLQCPLSITLAANFKLRGNLAHRVPKVTLHFRSLLADALDAQRPTPPDQNYPRQRQQDGDHRSSPPLNATLKAGTLGRNGGKVHRFERGPGAVGLTTVDLRRGVQRETALPALDAAGDLRMTALRASNSARSLRFGVIHRHSRQNSTRSASTCWR